MSAVTTRVSPQFVHHGTPKEQLTPEQSLKILQEALNKANEELKNENIVIVVKKQLPEDQPLVNCNLLLAIQRKDQDECIDIIDMRALDETSIKSAGDLAKEMVAKVWQHLLAQKTNGIFISSSGSKFDTRNLTGHHFAIDEKGYIRIDNHRVVLAGKSPAGYWVIKAESIRSYTIHRLIKDEDKVRLFDDHDLVRYNRRGMFIDPTKVEQIDLAEISEKSREDAQPYGERYVFLHRDVHTTESTQKLAQIMNTFPAP